MEFFITGGTNQFHTFLYFVKIYQLKILLIFWRFLKVFFYLKYHSKSTFYRFQLKCFFNVSLVLITSSIAFYLHFFYYRCAWQRCKIIDNWKERYQILMLKCRGLTVVSRHKPLITSRTYHETKFLSQNIVENFAHKLQHCKKYLKLDIAVQ